MSVGLYAHILKIKEHAFNKSHIKTKHFLTSKFNVMLKAVFNGKYRKRSTGNLMYTYKVTGPKAEQDEFVTIMALQANRDAATWQVVDNCPLHWVNVTQRMKNGQPAPIGSFNLLKNNASTNFIIDDTAQELRENERLADKILDAKAMVMAEIQLGIRGRGTTVNAPVTTTTTQAALPAGTNALDEELAAIQTAEHKTAEVPAGQEELGG